MIEATETLYKNSRVILLSMRNTGIIALFFLALDQFTKWAAIEYIGKNTISLLGNFFRLELHSNEGIAFSIAIPQYVIVLLTCFLIGGGIHLAKKELDLTKWQTQLLLGITIGGALGNLIDRIRLQSVIDFIAVAKFPVFNMADIGITVGIFGMVIFYNKLQNQSKPR